MKPLSVNELASLDSIVNQIQQNNSSKPKQFYQRVEWISLICALGVFIIEVAGQGSVSSMLRLTQFDRSLTYIMAIYMFVFLGIAVVTSFFIMNSQAQKENLSASAYLKRFKVMRVGALLSDLMVMSLFVIALMSLGKGVWVVPLLFVFTGHFLIQGYIFRFSEKISLSLAMVCFAGAGAAFYFQYFTVVPALLLFLVINGLSIIKSYR